MSDNLKEIRQKIESKRDVYLSGITNAHNCTKEQANDIFDSELETYIQRLYIELEKDKADKTRKGKSNFAFIKTSVGINIFMEAMNKGLSFSIESGHVYIYCKKGGGDCLGMEITVDGDIFLAQKAGLIHHLTEPVIVGNKDEFKIVNTPEGRQVAIGEIYFEEQGKFSLQDMKVGYIYIVYPNGDRELSWINRTRLEEYRDKSINKSMYNDESFIKTKIIKHALRKVGRTSIARNIKNEQQEYIAQNMEHEDDYPEVVVEESKEQNDSEPF